MAGMSGNRTRPGTFNSPTLVLKTRSATGRHSLPIHNECSARRCGVQAGRNVFCLLLGHGADTGATSAAFGGRTGGAVLRRMAVACCWRSHGESRECLPELLRAAFRAFRRIVGLGPNQHFEPIPAFFAAIFVNGHRQSLLKAQSQREKTTHSITAGRHGGVNRN
jgi:hypothetical protein